MTGPLTQQFAQVRDELNRCAFGTESTTGLHDALAALSAIERHVQDMDDALDRLDYWDTIEAALTTIPESSPYRETALRSLDHLKERVLTNHAMVREALERQREERDKAWFEERRGVDAAGNPTVSVWCRRCGVEHQRPEHCPARPESAEAEVRQLREREQNLRGELRRSDLRVRRLTEEAQRGQEPLAHLILDATTIRQAHKIARAALLSASPSDGPDDFCEHGYTTENAAHPSAGLERCPTCSPTDGGGA
jgi:hypothetical protein